MSKGGTIRWTDCAVPTIEIKPLSTRMLFLRQLKVFGMNFTDGKLPEPKEPCALSERRTVNRSPWIHVGGNCLNHRGMDGYVCPRTMSFN